MPTYLEDEIAASSASDLSSPPPSSSLDEAREEQLEEQGQAEKQVYEQSQKSQWQRRRGEQQNREGDLDSTTTKTRKDTGGASLVAKETSRAPASQESPEAQSTTEAKVDNISTPIAVDTAREKAIQTLETRNASLASEVEALRAKRDELWRQISEDKTFSGINDTHDADPTAAAQTLLQQHIRLLHDYNSMRDIGTGLLGLVAESRGIRARDVFEDFGVGEGD
ncbi:MAG: hypothetical protein M1819_007173 [Sarea resinae]|nr:MAG: hypothetical protein M1819_007173 [Sarea resinae]